VARSRRPVSRSLLRLLLIASALFVVLTVCLVLPLRWLPPLTSSFMLQNWFGQKSISADVHYDWVARDKISRRAALAVLAAEDQKFFSHRGFDVDSIQKVWKRNGKGRQVRGASTVSQQVAKNLWLWPTRSWFRKGLEAWFTLWVELFWPKERILEVYLNIAQFGPDVFGVEAAGRLYFRKPATALNEPEAALLAAVLPNPTLFKVRNPTRYVTRRQAWIQRQARHLGDELPAARWSARD
jgi:monofunctional biosynthetic peptidoglycan transglycosylase